MLIASAAMFFAVAGSAFIVRARMAGHCCDRAHPPVRANIQRATPVLVEPEGPDGAPCGQAIYRTRPDGTVAVDFRLCPDDRR
jgi:hypothetical protein